MFNYTLLGEKESSEEKFLLDMPNYTRPEYGDDEVDWAGDVIINPDPDPFEYNGAMDILALPLGLDKK